MSDLTRASAFDVTSDDADLEQTLTGRLQVAAACLLDNPPDVDHLDPPARSGALLDALVRSIQQDLAADRLWLLLTALCAAYPTLDEVDRARRQIEQSGPLTAAAKLLEVAFPIASEGGHMRASMEVVEGRVVVDVDHSAKYDLHVGSPRVARRLMPLWHRDHEVVPVAWNRAHRALRRLSAREAARVLQWGLERTEDREVDPALEPAGDEPDRLLVPWRSVVVMLEAPSGRASDRLAAIGDVSGNALVAVAHDAIPLGSPDRVSAEESGTVEPYLTSVASASRVAAESRWVAAELSRFVSDLPPQGQPRPLITQIPPRAPEVSTASGVTEGGTDVVGVPDVVVVDGHEPRMRDLDVLHAAEALWREGVSFSLTLIGGSGWEDGVTERVVVLQDAGQPVDVRRDVSDADRSAAFRAAAFTVVPYLPEGFGRAAPTSLAVGTPVITPEVGATAETRFDGGAVLVNPWDDGALIDAMRILLTDPVALAHLREEARHRSVRDWPEYAADLWAWLVEPERQALGTPSAP